MRISPEESNFLKKEISAIMPDALIYLFGSRADDDKKGGDIDNKEAETFFKDDPKITL